jgi:hypothetical protein
MAIYDDFTIGSTGYAQKRIRHTSGTTVYSVNAFYSWLMNEFDEQAQMDDDVPMSAQTPYDYTLVNGWFMDDTSYQFLKTGAITTSGYNGAIRVLTMSATAYTPCVSGDIGDAVLGGITGDTGILVDYNNTTRKWWVRMDAVDDLFDVAESITGPGTGTGTTIGPSTTGEDLFSNVYSLGTIATSPYGLVYIYQKDELLTGWWVRGHIDVLVKIKESGTEIANGVITVFNRQYGDLYDHYEIDVTTGGRNAVPLATSTDLNNTTGEIYLIPAATANFDVGNFVRGVTSGAYGELLAVEAGPNRFYLGTAKGTFQTSETLKETTNGLASGDTGTQTTNDASTAFTNVVAGYGGAGKILVYTVSGDLDYDAQTGDFAVGLTVTGGTSGATGVILKDTDAGVTGTLVLGNVIGSFKDNEVITDTGTGSADVNGTLNPAVTTIDKAYPLETAYPYNVVIDLNGDTVADFYQYLKYITREAQTFSIYNYNSSIRIIEFIAGGYVSCVESDVGKAVLGGTTTDAGTLLAYNNSTRKWTVKMALCTGVPATDSMFDVVETVSVTSGTGTGTTLGCSCAAPQDGAEYVITFPGYSPVKAEPFGTFAGGTYFGARGIWIEDMAVADIKSYSLTDANGTVRNPPNQVNIMVGSVVLGDTVAVFKTTGDNYIIDKSQYTCVAQGSGVGYVRVNPSSPIPNDTPLTGYIRVCKITAGKIVSEQRYEYVSWNNDDQPTYSTFVLSGTTSEVYTTDDRAYVPYLDTTAGGTSATVTVTYVSARTVMAVVRRYDGTTPPGDSIIPFRTKGSIGATGYTATAIRTPDGIVN